MGISGQSLSCGNVQLMPQQKFKRSILAISILSFAMVLFQNCTQDGMKTLSSSGLSSKNQTGSAPTTTTLAPVFSAGPTPPVGAMVFYISPSGSDSRSCATAQNITTPKKTINSVIPCLSPGSWLYLLDGTYSGSNNIIYSLPSGMAALNGMLNFPSGNANNMITIAALNEGAVFLTGGEGINCDSELSPISGLLLCNPNSAYLVIQGLRFQDIRGRSIVGHHLRFYRNEFKGGCSTGNCSATAVGTANSSSTADILLEENWFHGLGGRYNLIVFNSSRVIVRRSVIRHDGGWSDPSNPGGLPEAGLSFYNAQDSAAENVVIVDSNLNYNYWYGAFYNLQNTGIPTPNQNNQFIGNIALNNKGVGLYTDHNPLGTSIVDSVFWDSENGGVSGSSAIINRITTGRSKVNSAGDFQGGVGFWGGSGGPAVSNTIAVNWISGKDFEGVASLTNFYSFNNSSITAGSINNSTPLANGFKYLTRIEAGSVLKMSGSGNGQIGAQVLYQIGAPGSLYGDAGWNAETTRSLWPFPNQARVKYEMCTAVGETRGFCGATSLSHYIWEYLNSSCPAGMCN
jgi:hypothetical protein